MHIGHEKFHVRGVTYGTFRAEGGSQFPGPGAGPAGPRGDGGGRDQRDPDLRAAADMAARHGARAWHPGHGRLRLGAARRLPRRPRAGPADSGAPRRGGQGCEGHPAILCYSIGNEIPAPIVRWHGKRPVERFLERLYWEAKSADPDGLVTYVNYPSTEYLELPFLDLTAFNVFLEQEGAFESYMARLQNLSGDRPLLITEFGIDSRRNGARAAGADPGVAGPPRLRHRRRRRPSSSPGPTSGTAAATTCDDWDFGLVDRERQPKPALAAVGHAYAAVPFAAAAAPGRRSRSSSAPTTASAPSTSAWRGSATSPTPTTR